MTPSSSSSTTSNCQRPLPGGPDTAGKLAGHWNLQKDYVLLPSDDPEWQQLQFLAALCIGKAGHKAGLDEYQIDELREILGLDLPTDVAGKEPIAPAPRGEVE